MQIFLDLIFLKPNTLSDTNPQQLEDKNEPLLNHYFNHSIIYIFTNNIHNKKNQEQAQLFQMLKQIYPDI